MTPKKQGLPRSQRGCGGKCVIITEKEIRPEHEVVRAQHTPLLGLVHVPRETLELLRAEDSRLNRIILSHQLSDDGLKDHTGFRAVDDRYVLEDPGCRGFGRQPPPKHIWGLREACVSLTRLLTWSVPSVGVSYMVHHEFLLIEGDLERAV